MRIIRSGKYLMREKLWMIVGYCGVMVSLCSCWAAAAGAGAETGYVAAQENRTAGETIDDQLITSSLKAKLLADPDVAGLSINVDTYRGNVILRGYVKSRYDEERAILLAQKTRGVKSVVSKMVLDVPVTR